MKLRQSSIAGALLALTTLGMGVGFLPLTTQPAIAQEATCDGRIPPVIAFETRSYYAYICEQVQGSRTQLYYVGIDKDDPALYISAPIERQSGETYVARSGNTVYQVNSRTLEITQNGRRTVSESVIRTIEPRDSSQESEVVLRACRERGAWELGTTASDLVIVDSRPDRSGIRTVTLRSRRDGREATCRSTLEGRIVAFEVDRNTDDDDTPWDDNDDVVTNPTGEVRFQTLSYAVRVYESGRNNRRMNIINVATGRQMLTNTPVAVNTNSRTGETTYTTTEVNGMVYTARVKRNGETTLEIFSNNRPLALEYATINNGSNPGSGFNLSSIPRESVQACRTRALFELDTNNSNLDIYDGSMNRQGTYTLMMRLKNDTDTQALCEVRGTQVTRFSMR